MSPTRASDADRDRVAGELRDHFAAGRISEEELDDRVQRAYAAGTVGELEQLQADLPAPPQSVTAQRAELAERRGELRRRMLQQAGGAFGAFLICCVIWVAVGASGHFWPIWVAIAPVVFLARTGWMLYGPAPELDRVEAELERRKDRRGHGHG